MRELVIAKRIREHAQDRDTALAWQIVAIYAKARHDKKVPTLKSMLAMNRPPPRQNLKQQRTMLDVLSDAYKIPLRKRPKNIRIVTVDGQVISRGK